MEKSAEAFRTISEVSELLDTPAHVLRFWESRFSQVRPVKRAGGRRYYRPNDLALLAGIKRLLHEDGLTIRGVQKILKEQGVRHVAGMSRVELSGPETNSVAPSPSPADASPAPGPKTWPSSPSPDAAEPGDRLQPDPDDIDIPVTGPVPATEHEPERPAARAAATPEAPMEVDAPLLPQGNENNVLPLGAPFSPAPGTSAAPTTAEDGERQPAAAMLRAMDALRVRDRKSELMSVYRRLSDLKERMSRSEQAGQD